MTSLVKTRDTTITDLSNISNKVTEELDLLKIEYLSKAEAIMSSDDTYVTKLDKLKKLSNKLVKVRTQSELTNDFKALKARIKSISDTVREEESKYINGIKEVENAINEPLEKEKERVEKINEYLKEVEKTMLDINECLVSSNSKDLTKTELDMMLYRMKASYVIPDTKEWDDVSFSKVTETLYTNNKRLIDILMKTASDSSKIREFELEVTEEPEKDDYCLSLINKSKLGNKATLFAILEEFYKNQLTQGTISIAKALSILIEELEKENLCQYTK